MSSAPPSQGYIHAAVNDLVSGAAREADEIDDIIRMAEAGIKPPKKGETQSQTLPPPPGLSTPLAPLQPPVATIYPLPEPTEEKSDKPEKSEEKKSKKDKPMKMVYSDNDISPEEKMAMMPRYAFVPEGKTEAALVDAKMVPAVAGTVGE